MLTMIFLSQNLFYHKKLYLNEFKWISCLSLFKYIFNDNLYYLYVVI